MEMEPAAALPLQRFLACVEAAAVCDGTAHEAGVVLHEAQDWLKVTHSCRRHAFSADGEPVQACVDLCPLHAPYEARQAHAWLDAFDGRADLPSKRLHVNAGGRLQLATDSN